MTINTTSLLKAVFAALTMGIFTVTVSAPVTLDGGMLTEKSAYAAKGSGSGGNGADDGTPDQGGGNDDDAPDGTDDDGTPDQGGGNDDDAPDGTDDDGTPDQGPGDN